LFESFQQFSASFVIMEKFYWELVIRTNLQMLHSVGLWPKNDEIYKLDLYSFYAAFSVIIIMIGHNFFQLMYVFSVYKNLEALTEMMVITATDFLITIKLCFFLLNMRKVKELMITLNSVLFQPKSFQLDLIRPHLNIWKKTYIGYWMLVGSAVVAMVIFPFVDNSFKDHRLPFLTWYPFDATISPVYEIIYIYQVVGVSFRTVAVVNMDTLIAALMVYITTQCDILCDNLRNIDKNFYETLFIKCIRHHQEVVRFAKSSNNFFNVIILGQFFSSTTVIAFTLFQLSLVDPLSSAGFSHMSYISAIVVQVYLYCWFGNEIELK
ncbi:7tm 6 domain containing protein, partial [Asbolus verrucosus]